MKTVLFQGDSITDSGRDKENLYDLGNGYPLLVAARLGLDSPGEYSFFNRAVSGDRIVDVYARMKRDIINIRPDFLSLLVGVNDEWHELDFHDGVDCDKFKKIYRMLLTELMNELPSMQLILLEPYLTMGSATKKYYNELRKGVSLRAEIVRDLAYEFEIPFIPLQNRLDKLVESNPVNCFLQDGVHPNPAFHQYIADMWLEAFKNLIARH